MSPIWMKSAVVIAGAALLPVIAASAMAQRQDTGAQSVPVETQEVLPVSERQSKPRETEGTPTELRLRSDNAAGVCTTKADSEGEAVENCTENLKCQPPAAPSCKKRGNFDDWRCVCK